MPNRIGNFELTQTAFNARKSSPKGFAPSDVDGLSRWGIVKQNGEYEPILLQTIGPSNIADAVRNFLNWAIVGDVNTAYPPIVNVILCLKYKRVHNAVFSGQADGQRTMLNILRTNIERLLKLQKYISMPEELNKKECKFVSPNFNPTEVRLKAEQMLKQSQQKGGPGCYQKCGDVYIYGGIRTLKKTGMDVVDLLAASEKPSVPTTPALKTKGEQAGVGPIGPVPVVAPPVSKSSNTDSNPTPVMTKNVPPPHTQAELNAARQQWKKNLEKKPNESPSAPGNNTPNWVKQGLEKNAAQVDVDEADVIPYAPNVAPPPTDEELEAARQKWKKNMEKKPNESPSAPGNNTPNWAQEGRTKNEERANAKVNKVNVNNPPFFGNFTRKSPFTKGSNQIRLNGSNNKAFSYNNPMWNKTRRHGKQTSANRNAANKAAANKAAANKVAANKVAANAKAAANKAAANKAAANKAAANKAAADKAAANAKAAANKAAANATRVAEENRTRRQNAATSARNKEEAKAKAIADKAVANAKAAANKAAANKAAANKAAANAKAAANKAAANAKAAANKARANQLAKTQKAKNTLMKRVTGTRKLRPANNFTGPMTPPETPRNNTPPPNSPPNSPPPTPSNTTGLARTWGQAKKFPQRKPSNENSNNGRSRASTLGALPENINRRSSNILELEDQGATRRTLGANASTRRGFGPTSTKPPTGVGRNASNTLGFSPGEISRQVKEQQARRKAAQTTNEARPLPALPKAQRRPLGLGFGVNGPTSRLPSMAPSSRGFGVTQPPIAVARAINAAIPAPRLEEVRPLPSLPPVVRLPKRAVLGSEYDRTPAPRSSLESMAASSRGLGGLAPVPLRSALRDPEPAPPSNTNVRPLPPAPPVAPVRTMNTGPNPANVRPLPPTPLPQPPNTQLPSETSSRALWQPAKPRGSVPPTRKLSRKRASRANKTRRH